MADWSRSHGDSQMRNQLPGAGHVFEKRKVTVLRCWTG